MKLWNASRIEQARPRAIIILHASSYDVKGIESGRNLSAIVSLEKS